MYERQKLAEARYVLSRMLSERGNYSAVSHELSAFLAAARSVLQYARKEALSKPGGQQWYDQAMTDPLLSFFRDKRDAAIHDGPVRPERGVSIEQAGFLNLGNEDEEILIPYPHQQIVEHYEFHDRPGEDVYDMCAGCLEKLDKFIEDGVSQGWITG